MTQFRPQRLEIIQAVDGHLQATNQLRRLIFHGRFEHCPDGGVQCEELAVEQHHHRLREVLNGVETIPDELLFFARHSIVAPAFSPSF